MTEQSYPDGAALWRALTTRAKALAVDSSSDSGAIVRRFVFERFLARVFHHPERPWVLKGGTALLARVHDARTTKDIDLYRRDRDLAAAVRELREVVEIDLADHFRFAITNVEILPGGDGQPRVQGARLSVDAYIGIARKQTFSVDLVTGSLITATPDVVATTVLQLRGVTSPSIRLYPVVDHIADKVCAVSSRYGLDGNRPSSRVRDLVDLVVLARTQQIVGAELTEAIHGEWDYRGLPGTPHLTAPSAWERLYPGIARKVPACGDFTTFASASALVAELVTPAIARTVDNHHWYPADTAWHADMGPAPRSQTQARFG